MLMRLVAATVVAGTVLLLVWAVCRTLRRPMPPLVWPLVIAASLFGYSVYDEYSWASRTRDGLPERIVTVGEGHGTSPFSPWTYLVPRTERLSVIDRATIRTHPERPGLRLVEVVLLERARSTLRVNEIIDCDTDRYAVLATAPVFGADGLPVGAAWQTLPDGAPRLRVACAGA